MKNKLTSNCINILLLFCALSYSQKDHKIIDEKFTQSMNNFIKKVDSTFNIEFGLGMSIVKDDKLIYETYRGMADTEKKVPVTSDTRFYIASSTKSFFALAMLILHEKNKIDLDKSLADYFPKAKFKSEVKADSVTLRHLLIHTSGLLNDEVTWFKAYIGNYTTDELIRDLIENTSTNEVGFGVFSYDNLGYNILELILEKELGLGWRNVVQEEILTPLDMNQTSCRMSDLSKYNWPDAEPYEQVNSQGDLKHVGFKKKDEIMHAAGGMISTPQDMVKWLRVQLNNGVLNGKQVFTKELIENSHKIQAIQKEVFVDMERYGYGYGWNIGKDTDGDTIIHHFGGYPGYHSEVSLMPSKNMGIAILVNEGQSTGMLAAYLISNYAFDYFAHPDDVDVKYTALLDSYRPMLLDEFKYLDEEKQKRDQREWQLNLPFEAYIGHYQSDSFGEFQIDYSEDSGFRAKLGLLETETVNPFTRKNSMRIEFLGKGYAVQFNVVNKQVTSLSFKGHNYTRVK